MADAPPTVLRAEQYLAPETLAQLAPFELRAKMVAEGAMNGHHISPRQGAAVEFASHRQYAAGDGVRHVDWKVFARSDKLYIKQYQQETNLNVAILVDGSASMQFGTLTTKSGWGGTKAQRGVDRWTKFDHATAIAAALSFLALTQRDRVSVGVFADGIRVGVRGSSSQDHWRAVVRCLATEPIRGAVHWTKVADQALSKHHTRTLFVILSDFISPIDQVRGALARLRHKGHDAILGIVMDHEELEFTRDLDAQFDGMEGEESLSVDTRAIREAYRAVLTEHLGAMDRIARGFGFDSAVFDSHKSVGPALSALLSRREAFDRRRSPR